MRGLASHVLSLLLWQSEIRKTFADTMSAGESSVPKSGVKSPSKSESAPDDDVGTLLVSVQVHVLYKYTGKK